MVLRLGGRREDRWEGRPVKWVRGAERIDYEEKGVERGREGWGIPEGWIDEGKLKWKRGDERFCLS